MPQNSAADNAFARLLDTQFKIPGTNWRFGLDPILGLIPGVGDFLSFLMQAWLVLSIFSKGVSGELAARLTFNILLDTLVGSIPIIGQAWDFWFKANQRNLKLATDYWHYNKYKSNGWGYWLLLIALLIGAIALIVFLVITVIQFIFSLFSG
jgi:hypothetical protein